MQIFISYSRVDKAFAQRLADDLRNNGYQVWLDVQNIPHGANWDMEVQNGLDSSDTMIVMLTPTAAASQNVADEWSYFIDKGKRILPLMVQPCEVPFRLSRRQRIDFIQGYDPGLAELIRALKEPVARLYENAGDTTVSSIDVSWAAHYNWWRGLVPPLTTGSATVTHAELRLLAPGHLPFVIPLTSLVGARPVARPWDTYLWLDYVDRVDTPHKIAVIGTSRSNRSTIANELLNLLKVSSGRALT